MSWKSKIYFKMKIYFNSISYFIHIFLIFLLNAANFQKVVPFQVKHVIIEFKILMLINIFFSF